MNSENNPTLKSSIRIGLTIGDPAGIGPAIALSALKILEKNHFKVTVIGDAHILEKAAGLLNIPLPGAIDLVDLKNAQGIKFGQLSKKAGQASLEYLDAALALLEEKRLDCLVTCPVSKEAVSLAGARFTGHTEYLAQKTKSLDQVMMLLNDKLKFSLLTRHLPLSAVPAQINRRNLETNIIKTAQALKELFAISSPRLVVCGVNPHASDNGLIGKEEAGVIAPALAGLRAKLRPAKLSGPLSADAAVAKAYKGDFDCVIAAYHDQALIPLKLTGFNSGVNLTLGLPFVRTSPLHGVAFDIAAHPKMASPDSLIAAIKLAARCALNQKKA